VAALEYRDRTGEGVWIDAAQYEAGIGMIGDGYVAHALGAPPPERAGNVEPGYPLAGCYPCAGSDAWVALVVQDPAAWAALCDVLADPCASSRRDPWSAPLTADERSAIDRSISAWTSTRSPSECMTELQRRGIAAGSVNSVRDLLLDPHLAERDFYQLVDHAPEQAAGRRAWPGVPARLSATPGAVTRPAPMLGQHNRELALGLLGYSEAEYEGLVQRGALGTTPASAPIRPPRETPEERLNLSPWAARRIKEYDAAFEDRLRERFGPEFGSAAQSPEGPAMTS